MYLGGIMLRDDQKLRVSGDSRDKPRRGVFHHSAGIRPIGWVGPRFYMHCSKTSLEPRFHPLPKSLAMNVPLADSLPCACITTIGDDAHCFPPCPNSRLLEEIWPPLASLIIILAHSVEGNLTPSSKESLTFRSHPVRAAPRLSEHRRPRQIIAGWRKPLPPVDPLRDPLASF